MKDGLLTALGDISQDQIFRACGTVGGLLLAGAQLPQIYHVTTRNVPPRDVSYVYQFTFLGGMVMFLIYYGYYHLWAVFIPACFSFACMGYLIGLKAYLEILKPKRTKAKMINDLLRDDDDDDDDDGLENDLDRPLLSRDADDKGEDSFIAYTAAVEE